MGSGSTRRSSPPSPAVKRSLRFWRAASACWVSKYKGQTVVLVGHNSINRVILSLTFGLPLSRYWRIKQEPCCVNEVPVDGETINIQRINEGHHLVYLADEVIHTKVQKELQNTQRMANGCAVAL